MHTKPFIFNITPCHRSLLFYIILFTSSRLHATALVILHTSIILIKCVNAFKNYVYMYIGPQYSYIRRLYQKQLKNDEFHKQFLVQVNWSSTQARKTTKWKHILVKATPLHFKMWIALTFPRPPALVYTLLILCILFLLCTGTSQKN